MSDQPKAWGTSRRLGVAATVGLQLLMLAVIVIGINWVSSRRYRRWDWTDEVNYTLSDKTRQVIAHIAEGKDRFQIVIFYAPDDYGAWDAAIARTKDLLEEYKTHSHGKLAYDVVTMLAVGREGTMAAKKKFDIRSEFGVNDVIFKKGDTERIVNLSEFFQNEWTGIGPRQAPKLSHFNGEQIITSMLQVLSQERPVVLGFVGGHGEISPDDTEQAGWAQFAHGILAKREGYGIRPDVKIGGPEGVPKLLDVLMIVSPQQDFTDQEIQNLKIWVNAGGRLLVSLDSGPEHENAKTPNLTGFLNAWGIEPGLDIVFDPENALRIRVGGDMNPVQDPTLIRAASFDRKHPVTEKFDDDKEVNFAGACSVMVNGDKVPEGFKADELVHTATNSWAETEFPGSKKYDPNRDLQGPVGLAVAVSGKVKGNPGDETRIVVIGDSTAIVNYMWGQAGVARPDLFLNSVRWLGKQEYLIGVDEKRPEDRSMNLTAVQDSYVFRVAVLFLPLLAIAFGGTMWLTRRSQ